MMAMVDERAPDTERPAHGCACGLQYSEEAWSGLHQVAERWDVGGDGVDVLELRDCHCGSTLAREVSP